MEREQLRKQRISIYEHFRNCPEIDIPQYNQENNYCTFYDFNSNNRNVDINFNHFQLRRMLKSYDKLQLFYYSNKQSSINSYNPLSNSKQLKVQGQSENNDFLITDFDVNERFIVTGLMNGIVQIYNKETGKSLFNENLSTSDNSITNTAEFQFFQGEDKLFIANNEKKIYIKNMYNGTNQKMFNFDFCVNHCKINPTNDILAVVGDTRDTVLIDTKSDQVINKFCTGYDFGFYVSWHPLNQFVFALANQDGLCKVYDIRKLQPIAPQNKLDICQPLHMLYGNMCQVLHCNFSNNGQFLAFQESADFVHIYSTVTYKEVQLIDLFGELSGFTFSKDDAYLYIGVSDPQYRSLLTFQLNNHKSAYNFSIQQLQLLSQLINTSICSYNQSISLVMHYTPNLLYFNHSYSLLSYFTIFFLYNLNANSYIYEPTIYSSQE